MDGARQIVIPATVSLLCICIVFVPMFGLGGVAGFLFRPMAKAVVFALIGSYVLSRTLVPTMANYLLAGHAQRSRRADRQSVFGRFQRGFEHGFERAARMAIARALAAAHRRCAGGSSSASSDSRCVSLLLAPFLGKNFFPDRRMRRRSSCTCAAPPGFASRRPGGCCDRVEDADPRHCRARRHRLDRRQHRPAHQRHQRRLWQFRHHRRRPTPTC